MLHFAWDPAKAESNRRKHGIDFGATAFGDPLSLTIPDPRIISARSATAAERNAYEQD